MPVYGQPVLVEGWLYRVLVPQQPCPPRPDPSRLLPANGGERGATNRSSTRLTAARLAEVAQVASLAGISRANYRAWSVPRTVQCLLQYGAATTIPCVT
jgi:hypothetical protein